MQVKIDRRFRRIVRLSSWVTMAVTMAAQGVALAQDSRVAGDWPKIVAAAKKEGKVHFYSSIPPAGMQRVVAGFSKAYPDIAIEAVRITGAPMLAKIDQERASGADGADAWMSAEWIWYAQRAREGVLLKPVGPALVGWPAQNIRQDVIAVVGREPYIIAYNKNLVKVPPKGYADLLNPEFKGKLGITHLSPTAIVAWYDWLEKSQGGDFLAKLRAQEPKIYPGAVPIGQAVASGEIAASPFGVPTSIKPLMDLNAPIAFAVPNPGSGYEYGLAAFSWSKRPNAALVLVDYIMSQEGQTALFSTGEGASPRSGVPGSLNFSAITPLDVLAYPPEVEKAYRERWTKIFNK